MKEIHLLCNAHIDPVWLWKRHEGIAETISTFRVAADFCEEYDGFVFNHNEALLYEWVEEYDPNLFKRIQKLVSQGKWHIMGGWYLQPDCVMLSGESFIRQIETGNRYFLEKFGVKTNTAINFDPFGHSRGLVQILKKSGYDNYILMRDGDTVTPNHDFLWKGYDASEIIGHKIFGGYNSKKGKIIEKLETFLPEMTNDVNLFLWGIGNHGGGPSRTDIEAIAEYQREHPELKLIHSWCGNYFKNIKKELLPEVAESLTNCMVGCYTSMVRIKQAHRALENELIMCEKMLAATDIDDYHEDLKQAEKALMFCQFHDVLPGSMIKAAEDEALGILSYGREIVSKLRDKAFFKLCEGQAKCKDGEIPIMVYNPHPFETEEIIECDFLLQLQNRNTDEYTFSRVYDENGFELPTQNELERSNFNLDWAKKIAFKAKLKPLSVTRFNCVPDVKKVEQNLYETFTSDKASALQTKDAPYLEDETHIIINTKDMTVKINKNTGLIDTYKVLGVDYLNESGMKIEAFKDDEDPWGSLTTGYFDKIGEFKVLSQKEYNEFNGYPEDTNQNVCVTENGKVRTKVQAVFRYNSSYAVVTYTVSKVTTDVDINIKLLSNDTKVLYKLTFDTTLSDSEFSGQTAFGHDKLLHNGEESVYQKWCALKSDNQCFGVLNRGTHGGSAKENMLSITLLHTPLYSSLPFYSRALATHSRFLNHVDLGERDFSFRLTVDADNLERLAECYNQAPYPLSFFPSGDGAVQKTLAELDNKSVVLSRLKKTQNGNLLIRLFNPKNCSDAAMLTIYDKKFNITLSPFEVKTFNFDGDTLKECSIIGL